MTRPRSLPSFVVKGAAFAAVPMSITGSWIASEELLIIVLLPVTIRFPPINTLLAKLAIPPTYRLPPIPAPPVTTNAPDVVLIAGFVPETITVVLLVKPVKIVLYVPASTVSLRLFIFPLASTSYILY